MKKLNIFWRVLAGIVAIIFISASGLLAFFINDSLLNKVNSAVFFIVGVKFGHFAITGKDKFFIRLII